MSSPFTDAYDAIWTCLEARSDFTTSVRSPNRIKFTDSERDPFNRLANVRSFPAVAVMPTGGSTFMQRDSDYTQVDKTFSILVAGGGQKLGDTLDVEFQVLRAMTDWRAQIQSSVTWSDRAPLLDVALFEHNEQLDRQLIERGIRGWSQVWNGRFQFQFVTTELQAA